MHNHVVAGWLLRLFLPRDYADAVLGDLLEGCAGNSTEFRKLLFGTLYSLGCRGVAGFFAASVFGGMALSLLQSFFFGSAHIGQADATIHAWASSLALITGFIWILTVFSLVRYGLRDIMALLAVGFAFLGSIATAFWWIPAIPSACLVLTLSFAIFCLWRTQTRRAFAALSVLTLAQLFIWFGGLTALMTPFAMMLGHTRMDSSLSKSLVLAGLAITYPVLMGTVCFACTRVRSWIAI